VLAAALIDQAAPVIGARIGGVELNGALEIAERLVRAAGAAVEFAAADKGLVIARIDLQRGIVVVGRARLVAEQAVDQRPVGIGLEEARIEGDGLVEVLERLAIAAAAAETLTDAGPVSGPGSGPDEADLPEFYALCDPDLDDAPSYYRMTPKEAAAMERDCPGVTVTPTGIRSDAAVNALPWHREAPFEDGSDAAEQGIYL
jgi:hypothetical protein